MSVFVDAVTMPGSRGGDAAAGLLMANGFFRGFRELAPPEVPDFVRDEFPEGPFFYAAVGYIDGHRTIILVTRDYRYTLAIMVRLPEGLSHEDQQQLRTKVQTTFALPVNGLLGNPDVEATPPRPDVVAILGRWVAGELI